MDWRAQFEEIMISIIVIGMSSHNVRDRETESREDKWLVQDKTKTGSQDL